MKKPNPIDCNGFSQYLKLQRRHLIHIEEFCPHPDTVDQKFFQLQKMQNLYKLNFSTNCFHKLIILKITVSNTYYLSMLTTVFQRVILEFTLLCNNRQTHLADIMQKPNLPIYSACTSAALRTQYGSFNLPFITKEGKF